MVECYLFFSQLMCLWLPLREKQWAEKRASPTTLNTVVLPVVFWVIPYNTVFPCCSEVLPRIPGYMSKNMFNFIVVKSDIWDNRRGEIFCEQLLPVCSSHKTIMWPQKFPLKWNFYHYLPTLMSCQTCILLLFLYIFFHENFWSK